MKGLESKKEGFGLLFKTVKEVVFYIL